MYPGRLPYSDTLNGMLIRPFRREDEERCKLLLINELWSSGGVVFRHVMLKEINSALILVCAAMVFIFFEMTPYLCILAMCTIVVLIYFGIYLNIAFKMVRIRREDIYSTYMADPFSCFWVVEIQSKSKRLRVSSDKSEQEKTNDTPYLNYRTIVGTIALTKNHTLDGGAWIKRLCLHKKCENRYIRKALLEIAMFFAYEQCYSSISIQVPVYRKSEITCNKTMFKLRQTFYKHIVGLFFRILMYEFIHDYDEFKKTNFSTSFTKEPYSSE